MKDTNGKFLLLFIQELINWLDERGHDPAREFFAGFLAKQERDGATQPQLRAMACAWAVAVQKWEDTRDPVDDGGDGEIDVEGQIEARERREYEAGKAQAEMRKAERQIYGPELAEQFHAQDDLNAFNRGEE